jgi:peptide/nickel transport system permease protein
LATYILRRVAQAPLLFIVVSMLTFAILRLGPFNPSDLILAAGSNPAKVAELRTTWGLDRPLPVQYGMYMWGAVRGDFGRSFTDNTPVSDVIATRLPATIELAVVSMVIGMIIGLGAGIVSAVKRDTPTDAAARTIGLVGVSLPTFWIGLMAITVFSLQLHWLPSGGRLDSTQEIQSHTGFYVFDALINGDFTGAWNAAQHLIMPACVLGLLVAGFLGRITRASIIEALGKEYIRTARAKGAGTTRVVVRHALRNGLLPIITILGLQFGLLLGGAAVTEAVFAYPGMGQLLVNAINVQDFPQIQASILILAGVYLLVNLIADLLYVLADPRIGS